MKTKKKLLIALLTMSCITAGAFAVSACSSEKENGKSAYEIAVANGFEGTEEEWLLSLKGSDGVDGNDGKNGVDGKSAYDLYVDSLEPDEIQLTYTQWLLSLKGDKGDTGEQGVQGEPGTPAHVHNFTDSPSVTLIQPTYTNPGLTYVTCQEDGCDEIKLVPVTGAGYKITVVDNDLNPVDGVEVTVDGDSAVTKDGVAVIEHAVRGVHEIQLKTENFTVTYSKTDADTPEFEIVLPQFLKVTQQPSLYNQNYTVESITEPGLYCFESRYSTSTAFAFENGGQNPLKYTVKILDSNSSYFNGEDFLKDDYSVYARGGDSVGGGFFNADDNSKTYTVIEVTAEQTEDGTVNTPIPVALGEQLTLSANTVYHSFNADGTKCLVSFSAESGATVKWLGNDVNGEGTALAEQYFIDGNLNYYFTVEGTGSVTLNRQYIEGEDRAHAITLTKGTASEVELGTLGGITDNVRWFKFTGVNTNTGYLTVASEKVSLIVYEGTTVIANEDISVLPVAVTADKEYFVRVLYKGSYEVDNTATFNLLLRDYVDTDALAEDNGQDKENPYALKADTQDEDYSNRKNGEVSFLWGSATNSERYLVFTATEAGELQFTGVRGGNVTLYSDAAFSIALANDKYTKVGSANGDICTVEMNADDTVYLKITGVTQRDVKATLSFTKLVPVDYTVVVKDGADNLVEGVSVELWNTDGKVGEAVTTNAQGEAVFSQITAGEYTIKIVSDDYSYDNVVTIEKSYVDCTTEVSVTALVNYTVTLELPEGVEASEFDGVTVTLKGTEATGELQNGTVTFSQKVKPGVYQIIIEKDGYNVTGSTSKTETQATVTVKVVSADVNRATGCSLFTDVYGRKTPEGSGLVVGENLLSGSGQLNAYGWFKGAGNYTFTVNDDELWIAALELNNGSVTQLVGGGKLVENDKIVSSDTKTVDSGEKVYTITVALTETDIVYISASDANATASITITKEA